MQKSIKLLRFVGTALDDLRAFPGAARQRAGFQLNKVQHGKDPDDWKPMIIVGQGVREIRIGVANDTFRVMYVTKFEDAIYVLHCFQKKSQKTDTADIDLAARRLKDLVKELKR